MLTPADGGRGPATGAAGRIWCGRKAGYSVVFRGRTWRWASVMAVGMAVATMGRDDAAAGEECAGSDELPAETWREIREITVAEGSQGPREARGRGKPGAEELYVQRPAGTGNPQGQAWRGGMGCLPPEPGRQRAQLLPVQRSQRHNVGDSGVRGRFQVAH